MPFLRTHRRWISTPCVSSGEHRLLWNAEEANKTAETKTETGTNPDTLTGMLKEFGKRKITGRGELQDIVKQVIENKGKAVGSFDIDMQKLKKGLITIAKSRDEMTSGGVIHPDNTVNDGEKKIIEDIENTFDKENILEELKKIAQDAGFVVKQVAPEKQSKEQIMQNAIQDIQTLSGDGNTTISIENSTMDPNQKIVTLETAAPGKATYRIKIILEVGKDDIVHPVRQPGPLVAQRGNVINPEKQDVGGAQKFRTFVEGAFPGRFNLMLPDGKKQFDNQEIAKEQTWKECLEKLKDGIQIPQGTVNVSFRPGNDRNSRILCLQVPSKTVLLENKSFVEISFVMQNDGLIHPSNALSIGIRPSDANAMVAYLKTLGMNVCTKTEKTVRETKTNEEQESRNAETRTCIDTLVTTLASRRPSVTIKRIGNDILEISDSQKNTHKQFQLMERDGIMRIGETGNFTNTFSYLVDAENPSDVAKMLDNKGYEIISQEERIEQNERIGKCIDNLVTTITKSDGTPLLTRSTPTTVTIQNKQGFLLEIPFYVDAGNVVRIWTKKNGPENVDAGNVGSVVAFLQKAGVDARKT